MRVLPLTLCAAVVLSGCNRDQQDKLDQNAIAEASGETATDARDQRCIAPTAHEAIKAELFRRAAEVRGSNAREYDQVAGYALLLIDGAAPVEAVGLRDAVDCRGHATLRLPPGLKVAGGRTTLAADLGFTVAPGGAVTLGDADDIVVPLATLAKVRAAVTPAAPAPVPIPAPDPLAPRPAPPTPPAPTPVATSNPSFNCARARTRSEIAVCANPALGALDRSMAAQYANALGGASPDTAALLRRTRDAFLGYRERCSTDACIANTYRGRIREITDIAAGRWQGR